jgi:ferric-dicitrate binding protein FerR (iron transport regulator)
MKELIKRYLRGELDDEEQLKLLTWIRLPGNKKEFVREKKHWYASDEVPELNDEGQNGLITFQNRMLNTMYSRSQKVKKIRQVINYAAIALLVLSLGAGVYSYQSLRYYTEPSVSTIVADGGQVSKVVLPDGSEAWINSMSRISYDNLYGKGNRSITLEGQGFFKVRKNAKVPFIVNTQHLKVEALGTMFDVDAYPSSNVTKVILQEGAVEVSSTQYPEVAERMKPGDMFQYDHDKKAASIQKVDMFRLFSWKEGMLNVYDLSLKETAEKLGRRFNCRFEVSEDIDDLKVTLSLREEDLSQVLNTLQTIIPVTIRAQGDVITIHPKK